MFSALGRVVHQDAGINYRVDFPDMEHEAASLYLRDLAASDCSPATLRSYAYDLLRWFRFLHARDVLWERATRADVRALVESMRTHPTATDMRRHVERRQPTNAVTGKPEARAGFAPRTINHQLAVLAAFYDFACTSDLGPLVNPVPSQRGPQGRPHQHTSPMQDMTRQPRATYRQRAPRTGWRGIPDAAVEQIFAALASNRDRALLSFWLSSGARASELLGLRHGDYDFGEHTITLTTKGSRARERVPVSVDAFVWLSLYMREAQPSAPGDPVWWTLQGQVRRPLTYAAARAMFARAQRGLGSNWTLHDLRHTAADRLLADPAFTIVDVQTVLRHVHLSTTTLYTQPHLDDVVEKVLAHHARPRPAAPSVEADYDDAAVRELLGLPG